MRKCWWLLWVLIACGLAASPAQARPLAGTRWEMRQGVEFCFYRAPWAKVIHLKPSPQGKEPALDYEWPAIYVLREDGRVDFTAEGYAMQMTWDGSDLMLAGGGKYPFRGEVPADTIPGQAAALPQMKPMVWHALLLQQVAGGFTWELKDVLRRYGIRDVVMLGDSDRDAPAVLAELDGRAEPALIRAQFARLTKVAQPGEGVFISIAGHGVLGTMFQSYREVDKLLGAFRPGVVRVVLLEGCNAGPGLSAIANAEVVYTGADVGECSSGRFLIDFVHGLKADFNFRKADRDRNGIVSLGEAFLLAADAEVARRQQGEGSVAPLRKASVPALDFRLSFVPFAAQLEWPK